jgi:uncharacterized glyoxalase superfamily protein PhnB
MANNPPKANPPEARIIPRLAYDDVPAAIDWLTRAFGFTERPGVRLTSPNSTLAWIELDGCPIMLGTTGGHELQSPKGIGKVSSHVIVYVDDIDQHFARAKAAGAVITVGLKDQFWGDRVYEANDLEGHHWYFAQRKRDIAPKDWQLPQGLKRT